MLRERPLLDHDATLNVAVAGDGPPLVLLHGVTRAWQDFGPLVGALAARWRVHAIDFRGHGRSHATAGRYRVLDYVDDALALLASEIDEPAVVYGHSLGAMVALAAAALAPEKVRGLVLEDPPFETMGARIGEAGLLDYFRQLATVAGLRAGVAATASALAEIQAPGPPGRPPQRLGDVRDAATLRLAARCLVAVDPEIFDPILSGRWMQGYDLRALARQVRAPLLLLQGNRAFGGMLADEDAARLRAEIADCSLVRFDDVVESRSGAVV